MNTMVLMLTALGLAMDAFAVSVSNAMCYRNMKLRQQVASSLSFGLFQGIMPAIGFFAGRLFSDLIQNVDHWIALVLLGVIGGKMAIEGFRALKDPEQCPTGNVYSVKSMLVQSLATSIDALAVGIGFAALQVNILAASATIAVITFVCCLIGTALGKRFGALLGDWAEIIGGLILVGIGVKIFADHMF